MIARIWHGYATPSTADTYERITREETFPSIRQRNIPGFQKIQLLRRNLPDKVEFITIMWFDSLEAIRAYAGESYEKAVVPAKSQANLSRFDEITQLYEILDEVAVESTITNK